jgi:hypothetical protein
LSPNGAPNGAQGANGVMLFASKIFGSPFGAPFCASNNGAHFFIVSNVAPFKTSHTPKKNSLTHHPRTVNKRLCLPHAHTHVILFLIFFYLKGG